MKSLIRRLARVRLSIGIAIFQGVLAVIAGLIQAKNNAPSATLTPSALMILGATVAGLASAVLLATYRVSPVLVGEVLVAQQPQLPDVRAHAPRIKELSQVT